MNRFGDIVIIHVQFLKCRFDLFFITFHQYTGKFDDIFFIQLRLRFQRFNRLNRRNHFESCRRGRFGDIRMSFLFGDFLDGCNQLGHVTLLRDIDIFDDLGYHRQFCGVVVHDIADDTVQRDHLRDDRIVGGFDDIGCRIDVTGLFKQFFVSGQNRQGSGTVDIRCRTLCQQRECNGLVPFAVVTITAYIHVDTLSDDTDISVGQFRRRFGICHAIRFQILRFQDIVTGISIQKSIQRDHISVCRDTPARFRCGRCELDISIVPATRKCHQYASCQYRSRGHTQFTEFHSTLLCLFLE